jgi:uncharacterized membrane protein YbhN (UPF0104 family)
MSRWMFVAKALIAVAVLAYLAQSGIISAVPLDRLSALPLPAAEAVVLIFLTLPIGAWRWWLLLRSQGVRLPWTAVYHINAIGNFSSLFLPGGISGDALRGGLILSQAGKGRRLTATLSVVVDRITGLLGLITVALAVVAVHFSEQRDGIDLARVPLILAAGLFTTFAAGFLGILFCRRLQSLPAIERLGRSGRLGSILATLIDAGAAYGKTLGTLAQVQVLAMLTHLFTVGALLVLANPMLPGRLDTTDWALATVVALLANVLPLTPGGLGVGEGAFAHVCDLLDPTHASGYGTVFLAYRALTALALLPGAVSWIVYRPARARAATAEETS